MDAGDAPSQSADPMNTLGPFGSGLGGPSSSSSSVGNPSSSSGPASSGQDSSSSTSGRGRGSRGGGRGGRGGRGGAKGPARPPIVYGGEGGRKKPGPKPKPKSELGRGGSSSASGRGGKTAKSETVEADAKEASKSGRGRGRGRGRGKGKGRSGASASVTAASRGDSMRDSTVRRSESEVRGSTAGPGGKPSAPGGGEEEDDEDLADEDDDDGGLLDNLGEEEMKWREEMERIRGQAMGPLVLAMSDEQYDRHESYRRAGFNRANLRRLINTHLSGGGSGSAVSQSIAMAFGGVAKVFVGEIIEGARRLSPNLPPGAPLPPSAILESYRLYSQSHSETGALARGRGNAESIHAGSAVGGGMGGRRRLF